MDFFANLIYMAPVILISLTVHEFSHGYVAKLLGDETAARQGRLSLNPLRHLDPLGTLMLFVVHFGWAKPVPINPLYFKGDRNRGVLLVSLAGPTSNFLLSLVSVAIIKMSLVFNFSNPILITFLFLMVQINIALAIFNLIPIPPLDGSKILASLLPPEKRNAIYELERYGFLILILLLYFGGRFLQPILLGVMKLEGLIFNIDLLSLLS